MTLYWFSRLSYAICITVCLGLVSQSAVGQTLTAPPAPDDQKEVDIEAAEEVKVELQGVLNPIETLRLATRDPGIVEKLCVSVGDVVKAGDTIAILDQKIYSAEVSAANSELAVAQEELRNEVDLEFAKISYAANQKVYQRSQLARQQFAKSVSKTELENLRLESERSRLSGIQAEKQKEIKELTASLQRDKLEIAMIRLENRTIKSKIDGMVVELLNTPGEFVNAGQPIARILNVDRLRVICSGRLTELNPNDIPEEAVFKFKQGDDWKSIDAKITFVSPEIDPVRQTYSIWAEIENKNNELKSGIVGKLVFSK